MQRLSFAVAAAVVVLAAVAPAVAEEQVSNVPQVSLSDLDLNTQTGVDTALNRIRRASRDDCGIDEQRNIDIGIYAVMSACVKADTTAQIDRLGNDPVRTRYEERNGPAISWR